MGWTWYRATRYFPNGGIDRRAECDAYFMEGLNRGHYEVLKSAMVGTVYYAAVKKLKRYEGYNENGDCIFLDLPPEEQIVFGAIFITSTRNMECYNFGYKPMDETMGPGECKCPKSIIVLLSETDNLYALHWRQKCLERCNGKPGIGKLPIGTVIEFQRDGETVRLKKHKPAYQFKTPFWWDGMHYVKKKDIPNDFIIVQEAG